MESDREVGHVAAVGFGARLLAALLAGALLGALGMVATGWILRGLGAMLHAPGAADAFRSFLSAGAWLWFPLWGAALGAIGALPWAGSAGQRVATLALALLLAAAPLVARPEVRQADDRNPTTPQAKLRSILRWSYRTPQTVLRIVGLSRDPDPRVRESAVLALGINVIVTDIERADAHRPARYLDSPVRDSLRIRLGECLSDPVEVIRAEAARGLWRSPYAFGSQPAAAETLAAILDRASAPESIERLAWLALDAAAGPPDAGLKAAAARFADATTDTALRRVALEAAR